MTIALYARRKRWPLTEVAVRLRHSRVHAEDCADCETKEGMLDVIERDISLSGALSEEERAKAREIADRCPVHRTLTSEIDRKSTRLNSSHSQISYAVFCLKKKKKDDLVRAS